MNPLVYLILVAGLSPLSSALFRPQKLVTYRPGSGLMFVLRRYQYGGSAFNPDFASMKGFAYENNDNCNVSSQADLGFAFDYDSSGMNDKVVMYRPGSGELWLLNDEGHRFTSSYAWIKDRTNGVGGYDLKSVNDRAFAFDYEHSRYQNHIVLYRPGSGLISILARDNSVSNGMQPFSPVYNRSNGMEGFNLMSSFDKVMSFDYDHSFCQDHIVMYRPGSGLISIFKNQNGVFSPVFQQSNGIGGYNLMSVNDRMFAFDFDHSGKQDHLVLYRPGSGLITILKNENGIFSPVYLLVSTGIGGFDLRSTDDYAFAYDYTGDGGKKKDHIVIVRPGTGIIYILKNENGKFSAVYGQNKYFEFGRGIGNFDLKSKHDKIFPIDQGYYSTWTPTIY